MITEAGKEGRPQCPEREQGCSALLENVLLAGLSSGQDGVFAAS